LLLGLVFGLSYNLIALQWFLGLAPLDWLGFNGLQGNLLAIGALLFETIHQGLLVAILSCILHFLPVTIAPYPIFEDGGLKLPALFTVPLVWVMFLNKLGNTPDFLGVPWSMIEYSQYKILPVIQIADLIGGIGVGFLIVLVNVALAIAAMYLIQQKVGTSKESATETVEFLSAWALTKRFPGGKKWQVDANYLVAALILIMVLTYGFAKLAGATAQFANIDASILQPNVNINMQKTEQRYSLTQLLDIQMKLLNEAKPGVCIFTESSLPTRLNEQPLLKDLLANIAKKKSLDIIVGAIDTDSTDHLFNAAFGISSDGLVQSRVYHKRYLVPFGEYSPIVNMPEWLRRLTNTPAGSGYTAGREPVVFNLGYGNVSPLICFETISPELAAASVRAGGQLLVNISDLAWFHESLIGEQMIACAVFRAIENRRYFIFAANTGPSAIITAAGAISGESLQNKQTLLSGKVAFNSSMTLFTKWFMF